MKLIEMSWPEVRAAQQLVAVLPLGATEQHGPHLAVSTDSAIVTAIAEAAEGALPGEVVLCPTLAFGSSHHHFGFPGALSLSPELYTQVVVELVESLLNSGFRRIVLFNGHGGNIVPVKQALNVLSYRHDAALGANIVLATCGEMDGAAFSGEPPMETPALTHADEYETSLMLYLHPERVRMERAQPSQRAAANGYIGWQNDQPYRGVSMSKSFHFLLDNGSNGQPQLATAAKGEHLMNRAVAATIDFLRDFQNWPFLPDLRAQTEASQ